jgi:hypothetical protein
MIRVFSLLLIFIPILAFSPEAKKPDIIVNVEGEKILSDNLGNVYIIKAESISKYDSKGILQKTFSNKTFGPITSADATNALRIILFYKDFNRVVTLDNTLSQNGDPIQLEALGFPLATLAASSHDNGLWIYDQQNFELIRLNRNLQVEQRTGNLSQLLGTDLQPDFLIEKDNRLFLNNPATGILIFDVFGTYSKTIPIKELKNFQVVDDNLIYFQKGNLQMWNLITTEQTNFTEPVDTASLGMLMEKNAIFDLQQKQLLIYNR